MTRLFGIAGLILLHTAILGQNSQLMVEEYPTPLTRERQSVTVGNTTEMWELRWKSAPKPACEPSDVSLTCPCTGFAYGEGGDLALVRVRNGEELDRLELTELFKGADVNLGDIAILQRWEPDSKSDFENSEKDDFFDIVSRRPVVRIMNFADYNHDGQPTEFFLQTDTMPCGKKIGVIVGISLANPRLHVFARANNPTQTLSLQQRIWEELGRSQKPIEIVDWPCGDHGSDEETTVLAEHTSKGVAGVRRTYSCPRYPTQNPIRIEPL